MAWKRDEIAWCAGFFEGEGTVLRHAWKGPKHGASNAVTLSVSQKAPEILERFRRFMGYGTIRKTSNRWGGSWEWRADNFEHVQAAIAAFWPWLSSKRREQARKALVDFLASSARSKAQREANPRWHNRKHGALGRFV